MSEKRFRAEVDDKGHLKIITNGETVLNDSYEVVDLLNEQQATISALNEKIEQRNALLDKIEKALGEPIEEWLLGAKYR